MSWFTAQLKRNIPELRGQDYTPTSLIEGTLSGGADLLHTIFDPKHRENLTYGLDRFSSNSQDLFSSTSVHTDRALRNPSGYMSSRWEGAGIGWRQEEGILGLGSPNAFFPSVGGSTSPNLEQFSIGSKKFTENLAFSIERSNYIFGEMHFPLLKWAFDPEKQKEFAQDLLDPKKSNLLIHDPRKWADYVKEKLYGPSDEEGASTAPAEEEEEYKVKGPGTLRGREATLQLNIGAKGLGRKSLRIGTKGMGKPKTGKYKTWRSGRTSLGYG